MGEGDAEGNGKTEIERARYAGIHRLGGASTAITF